MAENSDMRLSAMGDSMIAPHTQSLAASEMFTVEY